LSRQGSDPITLAYNPTSAGWLVSTLAQINSQQL